MNVNSVSAYDDYAYEIEPKKSGEGFFSPFTFLCFALILILFGFLVLLSSSMDEAILSGRPFWSRMGDHVVASLIGILLGVGYRFTPEKITSMLHVVTLPLSWTLMALSIYFPQLSFLAVPGAVLNVFSTIFLMCWAVPFVKARERRGFPLLAIIPIAVFSLVFTAYASGLGWFLILMVLILSISTVFNARKGYRFFFVLAGLVILLLLLMYSPSLFSDFSYSIFPVNDPSLYSSDLLYSRMAITDGGILGTGIGKGLYKLGILSDPSGEYIFATLFEETGILGLSLLLFSLLVIMIVGIRTQNRALRRGEYRNAALSIGLTVALVIPFFGNILHTMGLNPFGGLYLPFFSYSPISQTIYVFSSVILYCLIYKGGRYSDEEE